MPILHPRAVSAALTLTLAAAAACGKPPRHLVLKQSFAFTAPSAAVGGVTGGDRGELVAWSPRDPRLIWLSRGSRKALAHPSITRPVGAAVLRGRSLLGLGHGEREVEVLDAPSGALVRLHEGGTLAGRREVAGLKRAFNGIRAGSGWYALVPDADTMVAYHLVYVADGSSEGRVLATAMQPVRGVPQPGLSPAIRLSTWGDGVILTNPAAPYQSVVIDPAGKERPLVRPGGLRALGGRTAKWYSMPVQHIEGGFLQTFTDLNSDRRVFVVYDEQGTPRRASTIAAPVAIVGEQTNPDYLIGIRRTGRTELVGYTWTWQG